LVSELRLTAGCVLMDLASPAVSGTSVYANGLIYTFQTYIASVLSFVLGCRLQLSIPVTASCSSRLYCHHFKGIFNQK